MKKILILYTEYAPYLHACVLKLTHLFNYEVHIVRYPLDANAPFNFEETDKIKFHDRKLMSRDAIQKLYTALNPVCVLVAGWIDKDYNALLPAMKKSGKMLIGVIDNQWTGSLKQKIFLQVGRFFINKRFTHLWVPGIYQFEYLRRAGIDGNKIMTGYYCADSDLFLSQYVAHNNIPQRFIYVGRLLDIKGTPTLIKAMEEVNSKEKINWEFLIIGNGVYENEIRKLGEKYPNIIYRPFMQPAELARETSDGGVFVLPSNYDAWGAVVHEYAMLGFPFILSSMVGSRNYFVTPGYNGYIFDAEHPLSLANAFQKIMALDNSELKKMSVRSHEIGKTLNTDSWACRLNESIQYHYTK
jgi:glycosyltransferase involved in cell wall biosynthesis